MIGRLLFVLFLFLCGVGLFWSGMSDQALNDRLANEGAATNAEVTGRSTTKKRKGSRHYYVTVRFTDVTSSVNTTTADVPKEIYDKLAPGGTVGVRYLASDPNIVRVDGHTTSPWIKKAFGALLVLCAAAAFYFFVRRLFRPRIRDFIPPMAPPPGMPPPIP